MKREEILENITISNNGIFYIGGIPTNTNLINETKGLFSHTFEGCIQSFEINSDIITDFNQYEGANIQNCNIFNY